MSETIETLNKKTFYSSFMQLQNLFSAYINIICELKQKHADINKIPENEKNVLILSAQNLRYVCTNVYLLYTLNNNYESDEQENKKIIKKVYDESLRNTFIPEINNLDSFVELLQTYLSKHLSKTLITEDEKLVNEMLDGNTAKL